MLGNVSPIWKRFKHMEEILDPSIFQNPSTKMEFHSKDPYFYCIPPKNITDKFTTVQDICKFL